MVIQVAQLVYQSELVSKLATFHLTDKEMLAEQEMLAKQPLLAQFHMSVILAEQYMVAKQGMLATGLVWVQASPWVKIVKTVSLGFENL